MLGAAFAEALGDRAGIRRFGDSSVPMDESRRDRGDRRRRTAVRRDRPAVPRRACRTAPAPARRPRARVVRADRRARRSTCAAPGRNDHHLAEAAFKALGRALRVACEPDPRRDRRRVDEGLARMSGAGRAARRRRRRRLRRRQPRLDRAGAGRRRRGRPPGRRPATRSATRTCSSSRASGRRRRRWTGCAPAASSSRSPPGSQPDRPFLGICLGLQLLFEGSDEDGAETLGVLPGRTVRLEDAPTLPHIGWNQVERRREHPAFDGIAPDADFYFVHSYVGLPAAGADDAVLAETEHGSPVRVRGRARRPPGRPVPPGALRRRTACAWSPTSSRSPRAPPPGAPPDAPPPRDPVPRRRQRPGRQGHPLRRPASTRATRPSSPSATPARAPTSSCSSTSPPRPRAAGRCSTSSSGRPAGRSCR